MTGLDAQIILAILGFLIAAGHGIAISDGYLSDGARLYCKRGMIAGAVFVTPLVIRLWFTAVLG